MKTIEDKIKEIVSAYKADFTRINDEERYKWQAIGHYKAHWNIDAKDFGAMFSEAFKLADKLLAANRYYPYKIVMDYIKIEPETVRKLFRILYNESISLSQRYVDFRAGFDKFVNPIELNHYQDLHAISVYLSFEYPETYYIYQYKIYKAFREKTGFVEEKTKSKSEVWKLENYHCMCDLVLSIVSQDEELITMSKNRLDNSCYKDEAYHLLSMDIIYFASRLSKNQTEAEDEISYWPSLAEYNPNITVNNWTDILKNRTITSDENLSMLKMILEQGGESTCANLAQIYGNTYNYYNKLGSSFAEKVKKKYNCPDCMHNGVIRYYPVPFVGRSVIEGGKNRYSWKLRDELKEALENMDLPDIPVCDKDDIKTDVSKNTILYGPPGTGKTYHTVIYAVAIIENKELAAVGEEDYDDVLNRYNEYKAEGFIEFTTFHQSYGYEEFIEGIKPVMDNDDEKNDIQYEISSGLFKNFCDRASRLTLKQQKREIGIHNSSVIWKVSLEGTGDNPTRRECMENGHIRIGWDSYGENISSDTDFKVSGGKNVLNAFIYKMKAGDIVLSCYTATTIDAIGVVTGEHEWHNEYANYKRLRKVNWLVKNINENITEINNGANLTLSSVYKLNIALSDVMDIVEKNISDTTPEITPATNMEKKKNYVFVIDEINRGNISKIFGELITLIEPSKRIGQPEGMKVKLPYSQQFFGVPDNVYFIGTMNTADRSIATMDTALRRRFCFKEMMPDAEVLDGISVEDISIKEMFIRINKRITVLYDKEHTIGHAYFIPLRDNPAIEVLAAIFSEHIIPLLQEYFYEDYEKIRLILGDNNKVNPEEQFIILVENNYEKLFGSTEYDFEEVYSYEINYAAFDNIEAYRSI